MPILSYGSLNIDHFYQLDHIVEPGETTASKSYAICPGGKGLNQSIAMSRAGLKVVHAGKVGYDGNILLSTLAESSVDCSHVQSVASTASGHAIIQVSSDGQNSIIVHGGCNQTWEKREIQALFSKDIKWDAVVCQNEVNGLGTLFKEAELHDTPIILNTAPYHRNLDLFDFTKLHSLILN